VVKADLANAVLPLDKISEEIIKKCQTGRLASLLADPKGVK